MFVYVLFVVLISTILLVQSEETTAPVTSRNENIIPVTAELSLKAQGRRSLIMEQKKAKTIIETQKCFCKENTCASMSREGTGKDSKITICCVPKTNEHGNATNVVCMCCRKIDTSEAGLITGLYENKSVNHANAINFNNALAYFYPGSFAIYSPTVAPGKPTSDA
jgi:hypothetical protein